MPDVIVIADTSCLISLSRINFFSLLRDLYKEVFITQEIANEFGEVLPEWIKIKNPVNQNYKQLLSSTLDAGEASAIALAFEIKNVLLILDDLKGRQEAEKYGFKITGTLGVLYRAASHRLTNLLRSHR